VLSVTTFCTWPLCPLTPVDAFADLSWLAFSSAAGSFRIPHFTSL
jgi:hypothetical protein